MLVAYIYILKILEKLSHVVFSSILKKYGEKIKILKNR